MLRRVVRSLLPLLLLLVAACGGSSTSDRSTVRTSGSCAVEVEDGDHTFVSAEHHGFGFSLPPPASWTVDCEASGDRLVLARTASGNATVTVTRDAEPQVTDERGYIRDYMRDVRQAYIDEDVEVSLPEIVSFRDANLGVFETRRSVDGAPVVNVVVISLMPTEDGHVLRMLVIVPAEGRFGHPDHDRAARRAKEIAYSFGGL